MALLHVSRTVADLDRAEAFHRDALGFSRAGTQSPDPALTALLGARRIDARQLRRGRQVLELMAFDPPGAAYPADSAANDRWMQHCALVTDDMAADYARLEQAAYTPISTAGPQTLPGGIVAFKFRDPDGHPLELIAFPEPHAPTAGGIDHTAISVADAAASVAFYTGQLGLAEQSRQVNRGPAQDRLDGLAGTIVDVVALAPGMPAPHLELLAYRSPLGRPAPASRPADIGADRTVLRVDTLARQPNAVTLSDGTRAALLRDPDGHLVLLVDGGTKQA